MKKIVLVLLVSLAGCSRELKDGENAGSDYRERLLLEQIALEKQTVAKCEAMGGLVIYGDRRTEHFTRWEPAKSTDVTWIPFRACQFPQGNVVITPKDIEK